MSLAKGLSVYMNGVSLSCALQSIDATATTDALDSTTLCNTYRTYATGIKNGTVSASGIWDYDMTTLDEIHNVFSTAYNGGTEAVVTATLESIASNAVNKDAILFNAAQTSYNVDVQNGQLIMCTADFQASSGINYGKVIFNAAVNNTTTNGTAIDNSASSANGGLCQVHVQNPSEYGWTVKFQHSSDNSTWVDLTTLTSSGTGLKYEAQSAQITGTVERYVRARITASTGSITFVAAFARR